MGYLWGDINIERKEVFKRIAQYAARHVIPSLMYSFEGLIIYNKHKQFNANRPYRLISVITPFTLCYYKIYEIIYIIECFIYYSCNLI